MAAADSCPKTGGRFHPPRRTVRKRLGQPMPGRSPRIWCVNFPCTTAAFTFPSIRWASSCCADLPLGRALYAISVRRLAGLASGFLRTTPHGIALAFGSRFHTLISRRGLAPHELTPAPGVHKGLHCATGNWRFRCPVNPVVVPSPPVAATLRKAARDRSAGCAHPRVFALRAPRLKDHRPAHDSGPGRLRAAAYRSPARPSPASRARLRQ